MGDANEIREYMRILIGFYVLGASIIVKWFSKEKDTKPL